MDEEQRTIRVKGAEKLTGYRDINGRVKHPNPINKKNVSKYELDVYFMGYDIEV